MIGKRKIVSWEVMKLIGCFGLWLCVDNLKTITKKEQT